MTWIKATNGNVFELDDEDLVERYADRNGFESYDHDPRETPEDGEGELEGDPEQGDPEDGDTSPSPAAPHGNAAREKWVAHAEALGFEVPEDATREDIKTLVASTAQGE
ncbi:hypothetical protein [Oerskovia enterophila]|uniref:Lsr2 n=1 Tax=Oerskovia enterophila TaxID=43678 RepID=A0ABX2Y3B9_9CELL|nr:hypothetical protein [Oerskovia enterophila]OCI31053.1 hypothetical protein OERS_22630 [Oerskovia enterophila]